jgi:Tol biopolymer transport system component
MRARRTVLALGALALGAGGLALGAPGDVSRVSVGDDGAAGAAAASGGAVSATGRFVAFTSRARLTAADPGGRLELYVRDRASGRTVLASSSAAGVPGDGDVDEDPVTVPYALSVDGRFAVFSSTADNLVPGDANGAARDVFRKDLQTGDVALVDVNGQGQQANAAVAGDPDVSADGGRVAFGTGAATNLVPADASAASGVVVRDLAAGTTTLVSQGPGGAQADAVAEQPAISADGRSVAFESPATNLAPGQGPGTNVYVRDLAAGATRLASVGADGVAHGGASVPDLSGDGRFVTWQTVAADAPGADANGATEVYRRDMAAGTTVLVSARDGTGVASAAGDSRLAVISADGSRVAFESTAADLVGGDGNALSDVFVRDVPTGSTSRVSLGPGGAQALNASARAGLAANGGLATFDYDDGAPSHPLLPGDVNGLPDVFARELVPTDTTGPPIAAAPPDGSAVNGQIVTLTGTVGPDLSGVVAAALDGTPIALGPGGAFSVQLALNVGPNPITLTALDGSGNRSSATRMLIRTPDVTAPAAQGATRPRVSALRAKLTSRNRRLVVRFRLSAAARVRVQLLHVVKRPNSKPARLAYRGVRSVSRAMRAGRRSVVLRLPKLSPGPYQVRVSVVSRAGISQAVRPLRITAPKRTSR